ncbi:MAG: hypothetical protein HYV07_32340 [Deltaproteobacteria bacterium]|nr:hypothetical protein [Deltaproteobacteria bacterium]
MTIQRLLFSLIVASPLPAYAEEPTEGVAAAEEKDEDALEGDSPEAPDAEVVPVAPEPEPDVAEVTADDFFTFTDYVDSRVTFALTNVNVFAGPGDRTTQTSGYRIGIDPGYNLFLENVNTRFSGYESLSHLVLYKKTAAFFSDVETEAALAALVLADTNSGKLNLYDSGTYLRVIKKLGKGEERDVGSLDLTAWPVSADRFRLGYTYLISWGGTAIFPGKLQASSITEGAVPGLRFRYRAPKGDGYAFIGLKSALLLSREPGVEAGEQVPNFGVLAGGGIDLGKRFVLEANGGLFQKGAQVRPGLEGERIFAYGASARVSVYDGIPPPQSADLKLYKNDPRYPDDYNVFKPWKVGTGYSAGLEVNALFQNLEDPDFFGSEKLVTALSAGVVAAVQVDYLRLKLEGFFQSPDFILFNVPGFVPFQATPEGATTTPEFFAAIGAEYYVEAFHFQPSFSVGLKMPATYEGITLLDQGGVSGVGGAEPGATHVQIIVDETNRIVLPPGKGPQPVIGAMLKLPLYLSPTMVLAGELRAEINDNQPRLAQDNERGEVEYIFDDPLRLSLGLVLQSRF